MNVPLLDPPRGELVGALRAELRRLEKTNHPAREICSSGSPALDRLLPAGGFRHGTVTEWLADEAAAGAGTLALIAARSAAWEGGAVVVMDRNRGFYPPAAAALGLDLENVVIVRPRDRREEQWAWEQVLRSPAVAAAWGFLDEEAEEPVDPRTLRRWQLAAEQGGGLGLLLRSSRAESEPSWAEIQLAVAPRPSPHGRRLRVELVRARGQLSGGAVELAIDEVTGAVNEANTISHETTPLRVAPPLAPAAARYRSAGAS
jgi:protein ImuA